MSKDSQKNILETPFKWVAEKLGAKTVKIEQDTHIFRLGKECVKCKKSVLHRDAISVCQCYCFAHKECLKQQLSQFDISQCSTVQCQTCQNKIHVIYDSQYSLKLNFSIKGVITLLICIAFCVLSVVYLVNFKNSQKEALRPEEARTHHRQYAPYITIEQVVALGVIFVFGLCFWFCLIGMVLQRKTKIQEICSTNIEIKVSAFEQIQCRIREQSQHQICLKKQQDDL